MNVHLAKTKLFVSDKKQTIVSFAMRKLIMLTSWTLEFLLVKEKFAVTTDLQKTINLARQVVVEEVGIPKPRHFRSLMSD